MVMATMTKAGEIVRSSVSPFLMQQPPRARDVDAIRTTSHNIVMLPWYG